MLRLNPGDNQGIRYALASILLQLDAPVELRKLLKTYQDEAGVFLTWTAALLKFRQSGDTPRSAGLLHKATAENGHVPAPLLRWGLAGGRGKFAQPASYMLSSPEEAAMYLKDNAALWLATPRRVGLAAPHNGRAGRRQGQTGTTQAAPRAGAVAPATSPVWLCRGW